jgi:hypothetical protein
VRAAALAATLAACTLASAAHAADGRRVTVALFGDSVAEANHLRSPQRDGPAARLASELVGRGYERGATGLIPAMPARMAFNKVAHSDASKAVPGGWAAIGYGALPGLAGPSGYSAYTESPGATAKAPVDGTQLQVLYEAGSAPFSVSAGTQSWTIDPATQPSGPASTWLELPAGTRQVTVHGPLQPGPLVFDGLVVHRPVTHGRVQVEVQNLAHAGHGPGKDLDDRTVAAIRAQAYDVSILFWSPFLEVLADPRPGRPVPADVLDPLLARARLARESGSCLIVGAYPLPVARRVVGRIRAAERWVAQQSGCTYTGALRRLWNARTAERRGYVILDRIHPTARGYRKIAHALAPSLARLVATSAAAAR